MPKHPPPFPDFIPDSDPDSTPASGEVDSSEEDLASVPSTVQVGTPESENLEPRDLSSPRKSPGGSWRSLDGSWSLRNFDYGDSDIDDTQGSDAPPMLLPTPDQRAQAQSRQLQRKSGWTPRAPRAFQHRQSYATCTRQTEGERRHARIS